jgi:uncharacterized membrane protein YkvA (DUF1232 family)
VELAESSHTGYDHETMSEFDEFVLRGGQKISAGRVMDFRQKIPFILAKAESVDAPDFPSLRDQVKFLARYVEDTLDGVFSSSDPAAVTESVFALGYLLQDVDIIPDVVPGNGYADDSAVIRTVLRSHPAEFQAFAKASGFPLPGDIS